MAKFSDLQLRPSTRDLLQGQVDDFVGAGPLRYSRATPAPFNLWGYIQDAGNKTTGQDLTKEAVTTSKVLPVDEETISQERLNYINQPEYKDIQMMLEEQGRRANADYEAAKAIEAPINWRQAAEAADMWLGTDNARRMTQGQEDIRPTLLSRAKNAGEKLMQMRMSQQAGVLDYLNKRRDALAGKEQVVKLTEEKAGSSFTPKDVIDAYAAIEKARQADEKINNDRLKILFGEKPGKAGKTYNPDKDLEKHQKRMEGIEDLLTTYNILDTTLGGIDKLDSKKDIPGVGALVNILPSRLLSDKGSEIRQTFADLKNQVIYAKSGKQINEQEYRRLSTALGSANLDNEREFVNALKRFGIEIKAIMKQREAAVKGVHPEVLDLYKKGGGSVSSDFIPPTEKLGPASNQKGLSANELKELEELEKRFGGKP